MIKPSIQNEQSFVTHTCIRNKFTGKKTHRAQNCRAFSQPVKCTTPSGSKKGQDDIKKQRLVVYFRKPMTFCTDWGARNTSQH